MTATTEPSLLTHDQAAKYLGCSIATLARRVQRGYVSRVHLPSDRRVYYRQMDLDELRQKGSQRRRAFDEAQAWRDEASAQLDENRALQAKLNRLKAELTGIQTHFRGYGRVPVGALDQLITRHWPQD